MISLTRHHIVTGQQLADLISTGMEGVSGEWLKEFNLERVTVPITESPWYCDPAIWDSEETTVTAKFEDGKSVDLVTKTFDHASLVAALKLWAVEDEASFGEFAEDTGDAETSDIFLQFWLLGSVVFG